MILHTHPAWARISTIQEVYVLLTPILRVSVYISSYGVTVGLKHSVQADFFLRVSRRDDEDEMGKLLFAPRLCL